MTLLPFFRKNAVAGALLLVIHQAAAQDNYQFNPLFLGGKDGDVADLSWLEKGSDIPAGKYRTAVFVNGEFVADQEVTFIAGMINGTPQLLPCFTGKEMDELGLDRRHAVKLSPQDGCMALTDLFRGHDIKSDFDAGKLTLKLTFPQVLMQKRPRGFISPSSWEQGINSAFVSYIANGSQSEYLGDSRWQRTNYFFGLNSGINLGAWRIRDTSNWNYTNSQGGKWTHISTTLQRDIVPLKAQATLGETYTSSAIFDSAGVRGVLLASDDNMLPNSIRGYAPEVRGIARTNATVRIRQNGNVIYQTSVTPGEFIINDLYPTSSGGDLDVSIEESDGQVTHYVVPFASVPNLVRPGQLKYSLSAGKFRGGDQQTDPAFTQNDFFYGWRYGLTFYGGVQFSDRYRAYAAGAGQNLGAYGAFSVDVIHANSTLPDNSSHNGDSVRFRYSKVLNTAGTTLNFYSWQYTTKGFYTLGDTAYKRMKGGGNTVSLDEQGQPVVDTSSYYNLNYSRKMHNQLLLSQRIDGYGSLSLSLDQQRYWNSGKTTNSMQVAYNTSWKAISLGLAWQRSQTIWSDKNENTIAFSASVPLDKLLPGSRARYSMTNSARNGTTHTTGISGYVPDHDNLNYSLNARYGARSNNQSGADMSMQYQGRTGIYNAGYSYTPDSRYYNYGVNGGIVLHENGITLSQPLGNTNILVKAPGAANIKVGNQKGIYTDSRGYAVIPYASPYRENRVDLDVKTLGDNIEIPQSIVSKIPNNGAMARATLGTRMGYRAIFAIKKEGAWLPFGTTVALKNSEDATGIVGDAGALWLSGLPENGVLIAQWGREAHQRCVARYHLEAGNYNPNTNIYTQGLVCQ
ncbi:fimbria/pilus outer membrane usher protein [Erwinia amylovora]